jgi:hypothetical protein
MKSGYAKASKPDDRSWIATQNAALSFRNKTVTLFTEEKTV